MVREGVREEREESKERARYGRVGEEAQEQEQPSISRPFPRSKPQGSWTRVLEEAVDSRAGERDDVFIRTFSNPQKTLSRMDARGRSPTPKWGGEVTDQIDKSNEISLEVSPERTAEDVLSFEEWSEEEKNGRRCGRGRSREARGRSVTRKKISASGLHLKQISPKQGHTLRMDAAMSQE
jgi:hypothetical protein